MPTTSTTVTTKPATVAAKPVSKRVVNVAANIAKATKPSEAANAKAVNIASAAPVVVKPAAAILAAPVPNAPAIAVEAAPKPARILTNVKHTVATIAAAACSFGGTVSHRDECYLAFYAGFAKRGNGTVTVEAIAQSGKRPAYAGSNKPHDAGVVQRLTKAGLVALAADGASFTFTDKAKALAAYSTAA